MANPLSLVTSLPSIADTVDLLVKIAGRPLDAAIAASVLDVSVQQTLGQSSHLTLRLPAWDPDTDQLTLVDDPRLAPGSSVEVELGFLGQRRPVFWGEIVGLDLEASASDRAVVTINAYDILHRLGRGERQAKYEKTTCAGIVRSIAQTIYKIAADARDDVEADPENPVVFQENKSDFEFLTLLAEKIQYELFVDASGKKLVFRKSQLGQPAALALDARQDLVQFSARLDASGQLGGVEVRSFDSDNKKPIKVVLANPDSLDRRYGSAPSQSLITDQPLLTQEEAQAHAEAELLRIRARYLTASGTCFGRTELRPGLMIRITELGDRFGGDFHVTAATHTLSPSGGFRTSFELEGVPR
jgi:phage protein D